MEKHPPLDFFSWHGYGTTVTDMVERAHVMRGFMNSNGYERAENHMTEWNYVRNWDTERMYTQRVEMGDRLEKGTAYRMAMMIALQSKPQRNSTPAQASSVMFSFVRVP